jgi:NADP-dependent 3-hydroxy acid dehydrogenase YdfG
MLEVQSSGFVHVYYPKVSTNQYHSCATKHAVSAFTGSLMRELVDTPIRVTEIQPYVTFTSIEQMTKFDSLRLLFPGLH